MNTTSQPVRTRRQFLAGAGAAAAAVSLVPRSVLGGAKHIPPSERINLAYIGCGTQGFRQIMAALESPDLRIVTVCDPVRRSDDYPDLRWDAAKFEFTNSKEANEFIVRKNRPGWEI